MTIEKNGKTYKVKENKASWTLSIKYDNLEVQFNVSKVDCPDFNALEAFVSTNKAF